MFYSTKFLSLKNPILKLLSLIILITFYGKTSAQNLSPINNNNGTITMRWVVKGIVREAVVYIPESAKTKTTPVVFVYHGHGGNRLNMYKSRGFNKLWPEAIIIAPQGLNTPGKLTDPEGKLPGWQMVPGNMNNRDLNFFDTILVTFKNNYKVDSNRIYATGHSKGGSFTYLLWAIRGNIFTGVAPSATIGAGVVKLLESKPVMHIMGENDQSVKPEWQTKMCNELLKINSCSLTGEKYGAFSTLYPSKTNNPVVLYVHPGGHIYPQEANELVIKFLKA